MVQEAAKKVRAFPGGEPGHVMTTSGVATAPAGIGASTMNPAGLPNPIVPSTAPLINTGAASSYGYGTLPTSPATSPASFQPDCYLRSKPGFADKKTRLLIDWRKEAVQGNFRALTKSGAIIKMSGEFVFSKEQGSAGWWAEIILGRSSNLLRKYNVWVLRAEVNHVHTKRVVQTPKQTPTTKNSCC